ncbi:hypothetical protein SALBM217S_07038 [Streptomyces griseoloalbus]
MQLSAAPYDERLTAPRSWWLVSFLVGVSLALILLPFGTLPMLGGLAGGTAAAAVVASSYGSVRIRVVGDSLIAGEAKIPVSALGDAEILDPEEARAWRTHKADTRAFLLLRAYIPEGAAGRGHGPGRTRLRTCTCRPASRSGWPRR